MVTTAVIKDLFTQALSTVCSSYLPASVQRLEIMSAPSTPPPVAKQSAEDMEESRQLSIADLDGKHRELLVRAITRILLTEIAETTYAQIIDGLPTGDVAYDARKEPYNSLEGGVHPIDHAHNELCPGMLDKTREFRDGFRPEILRFNAEVSLPF